MKIFSSPLCRHRTGVLSVGWPGRILFFIGAPCSICSTIVDVLSDIHEIFHPR